MRRYLLCGALIGAGLFSHLPLAFAQFYQQRPIPQAPVPTMNRFSARGNAPAVPTSPAVMQDPLSQVGSPPTRNHLPQNAPQQNTPPLNAQPGNAPRQGGHHNGPGHGQNQGNQGQGNGDQGNSGQGHHGHGHAGWQGGSSHGNQGHWRSHPHFRNDFGWGWWSVGSPWGWSVSNVPWYGVPWYGMVGAPVPFTYVGINVVDPVFAQPMLNAPVQNPLPAAPGPALAPEPAKSKVRTSNAEQKARAGKFLGYGDTNFARQKYLAAIDRYKTAIEVAPDVPVGYLRQGVGLVALGQYANATKAFRRGLKLPVAWNGAPFQLDQLYGPAPLAKGEHLERLAKAVEANPLDAEPVIALGLMLLLDGHADRANVFFTRAVQLGGNEDGSLSVLLPQADPGAGLPGGKIKF